MAWTDEHLTMLSDCEQRESRLADWERGFVDGLRNWIKRDNCTVYDTHDHRAGKRLSPKPWETYTLPPNFSKGPRDPREPPSRSERVRQDIARHPDSTARNA